MTMKICLKHIFVFFFLIQLSSGYCQNGNKIKAEYNSRKGLDKIIFYEKLNLNQKRAYRDFFYKNFPKLASDEQITSNKAIQIRYKFSLAEVYNIKTDELKSIEILKEIQNDKDYQLSQTELMTVLVSLQKSYLNLNLYSNVFKINTEIASLRKKGADFPLWSYNFKSNLYARLKLFDKAIPQLKSEIKDLYKNPKRDSLIIPSAYNDLGFYYSLINNKDSAYYYYNFSLQKAEKSLKQTDYETYQRLKGVIKGNLGYLKMKSQHYKDAIPLLDEDINVSLKINDDPNGAASSLLLLVECYTKLGDYQKAQEKIDLVEKIRTDMNPDFRVNYYKTKAELLKKLNQNEEAYSFYQKAFNLGDSLNFEKQRMLLAGNDILYQLEEKDNLIEKQQADINTTQKRILSIVALSLGIILLMTLFYLYNSKKKRKEIEQKNEEISAKNATINESLAEKEMLLKEIHHRVKNNLQIISGILELQNLNINDESAKVILKEGQARIQSIALIHKTLYQSESFSNVPLESYLQELIQAIESTYKNSSTKIHTEINVENIELNINTAIPLSLIINEIITNCYKHAFTGKESGKITINLTKSDSDQYTLKIQDDGNGLPENFDPKKLHSVGFDLIQGLSKQLEGNFNFGNENGTTITIQFKEIKT